MSDFMERPHLINIFAYSVNLKANTLEKTNNKPLILVTNDDGFNSEGIRTLIKMALKFGDVVAIAPDEGRSGMSHAITIKYPLRINRVKHQEAYGFYSCNGTPVDCVKLGLNHLLDRKPDLLLSGINHGSNSSISIVYSGTMAAVTEGGLHGIPSIGFSITDYSAKPDFAASVYYGEMIINNTLTNGLPVNTCLNVNIPKAGLDQIKGINICRQAKGLWIEEFEKRTDPSRREYFWLTGYFKNYEPDAEDTDEWALRNGYVSVVPVLTDFSDHSAIDKLKSEYAEART